MLPRMKRFTGRGANQPFSCAQCGTEVAPLVGGGYRNHCPACLHSLHVDVNPGDRAADCGGVMEPIAVEHAAKKGWVLVHRCLRCGAVRRNRAALSDPVQPDDYDAIVALSSGVAAGGSPPGRW